MLKTCCSYIFVTDFVLYDSHACDSRVSLQFHVLQYPPRLCNYAEQRRRCGIAAQRWREKHKSLIFCKISAFSGHGTSMHSTRLHVDAAAFFSWVFSKTLVRDAHARQDLGVVALQVKVEVACHGSACRCSIDGAATAAWRTDFEIDSAG